MSVNKTIFRFQTFAIVLGLALCGSHAQAQDPAAATTAPSNSADSSAPAQRSSVAVDTIPAGTAITIRNWTQYKQFMPDGMVALFQGTYYWKMPADSRNGSRANHYPSATQDLPGSHREIRRAG